MTAKDQRRSQHLTGLVAGELDITSITDGSRAGRRGSSSTCQRMIPLVQSAPTASAVSGSSARRIDPLAARA